jgi:hypothetical protein
MTDMGYGDVDAGNAIRMLQSVMMQGSSSQRGAGIIKTPDEILIKDYYTIFGFRTNSINRTLLKYSRWKGYCV